MEEANNLSPSQIITSKRIIGGKKIALSRIARLDEIRTTSIYVMLTTHTMYYHCNIKHPETLSQTGAGNLTCTFMQISFQI